MKYLRVKNFDRFQHYKDRNPPWIKLYNELLDDFAFSQLPDTSKCHLMMIWLLASRHDNRVPDHADWIGRRINASESVDLETLVSAGFLVRCSTSLAERQQSAHPEGEESREEGEVETNRSGDSAREAVPDDREGVIGMAIRYANRGMSENPDLSHCWPIDVSHGRSRQAVADWMDEGISADVIFRAVYNGARRYKPDARNRQPRSLTYFEGAVYERWERAQAERVPDIDPDSEAAAVRADSRRETPGAYRRQRTSEPVVSSPPIKTIEQQREEKRKEQELADAKRARDDDDIRQWESSHEGEAKRLRERIAAEFDGGILAESKLRPTMEAEQYRTRVLAAIQNEHAAA